MHRITSNKLLKLMWEKFLLLVFILVFIQIFNVFFGTNSIYIAAFSLTGVLMFSKINLQLPKSIAIFVFLILFPLCVILPYIINSCHILWLNLTIVLISILTILFFLSPTLKYDSYIPFLFLYAINLNTQSNMSFHSMIYASLFGGLTIATTYLISHRAAKDNNDLNVLLQHFKESLPFIVKISIAILIAYFIGYELNYIKTSWIILTVIALTEVNIEYTYKKLYQRFFGTLVGLGIYLIFLFEISNKYPSSIPIILILISYAYTFVNQNYFVKIIFVTFNAINAAVMNTDLNLNHILFSRVEFVFIGSIIAISLGLIFHFIEKIQYKYFK